MAKDWKGIAQIKHELRPDETIFVLCSKHNITPVQYTPAGQDAQEVEDAGT